MTRHIFDRPMDYMHMMEIFDELCCTYNDISVNYIGSSIMGKGIPMIKLGAKEEALLYVGSHHGAEWISSSLLMRFICDYLELEKANRAPYGVRLSDLVYSVYVIPMLNPDGVDIAVNGVTDEHILYNRLISMNGSDDFTLWKANARGVDLNHNYNAGFCEYKAIEASLGIYGGAPTRYSGEYAESEPEVGALCNFLRFNENIKAVLTFHTQGEEIYYSSDGICPAGAKAKAKYFSRLSGYALGEAEGAAAYGGLTDWVIRELGRPSFTIECGKGKTPLPLSDGFSIYSRLRELLFCAPLMKL